MKGSINNKYCQRAASDTDATVGATVAVEGDVTCSVLALEWPVPLTALKMAEQINIEKKRATM